MSTVALLSELWELGVELTVNEDKLRYRARKGVMTPELRARLTEHKAELIALLRKLNNSLGAAPALARRPREQGNAAPMSFAQERLWFIDQLEPGNAAYNVSVAVRFTGALRVDVLELCLAEVINRHESLRTTFAMSDEQATQFIHPPQGATLGVEDLRGVPQDARETEARRLIDDAAQQPFDLARGPLLRFGLLQLGDDDYVLHSTLHHIVSDGWSMRVLMQEISTLYEALSNGRPSPLQELPIQYADFACWQRDWLRGEVVENLLSYWKKQLAGAPPVLELPTDRVRPIVQSYRGAREAIMLPQSLCEALVALSRQHEVTLYTTLLAAFKALLYRYSGQTDIVIGCPVAGRNRLELEALIGFFLNTLALRTDLSGNLTFRQLLHRVRDVLLGAYANQELPFEKIVEELQPERDLSHSPIFQVMFVFQNLPGAHGEMTNLSVRPVEVESHKTMFDLTLFLAKDADDNITGFFRYNTDLFTPVTIKRFVSDYQHLLEGVVANVEQRLSELPVLSEAELARISKLGDGIGPDTPFDAWGPEEIEQPIHRRFENQAEKYAQRVAVKTKKYVWTYAELNAHADSIADAILKLGRDEQTVALLFEHDAPMISAVLGALKAGKTYVPLDPLYPLERIAIILQDSQAGVLLTNNEHLPLAQSLVKGGDSVVNLDDLAPHASTHGSAVTATGAAACLLYSSGSTGQPKGAIQTHRHIMHVVGTYTNKLHVSKEDRLTLFSSYSHVAAMTDIFASLLNGATLYPIDVKAEGLEHLGEWLADEEITIYHSIPTLFRHFVEGLSEQARFAKMRAIVLGGEEVFEKDIEVYRSRFERDCIFVNMYGSTETTVSTMFMVDQQTEAVRSPVPVGYPVGENEILLLNEAGERAQVYGEIAIRSPYIPEGYWRRPEQSAAVFLPDPEDPAKRIYRTGDQGRRLSNGSFVLLGRQDFQVKIRGFRVELGEIESVIGGHPAVNEAVVKAWPEPSGDKRLAAYVVLQQEETLSGDELRQFVKEKLPAYMVPAAFVLLESLPLTPNGKVNRLALPAPDWSALELDGSFVAPRTPLEAEVANIWGAVLKVERISVHDSFFDLGGHSLLATRLISQLRKIFQVELPLRTLFGAPTIAGVAEAIESERQKTVASPKKTSGIKPLARQERRAVRTAGGELLVAERLKADPR